MSNVIKSSDVRYDAQPRVLVLRNGEVSLGHSTVEDILTYNARQSADLSLRTALEKAMEITDRTKIETKLSETKAEEEGKVAGFEEGYRSSIPEADRKAADAVEDAVRALLSQISDEDRAFIDRVEDERADCVAFACGLVRNLFGYPVDCEDAETAGILAAFMAPRKEQVVLRADGRSWSFDTFHSALLADCAKDAAHVTAQVPAPSILAQESNGDVSFAEEVEEGPARHSEVSTNPEDQTAEQQAPVEREEHGQAETGRPRLCVEEPLPRYDRQAENAHTQVEESLMKALADKWDNAQTGQKPTAQGGAAEQSEPIYEQEKFLFVRPAVKKVKQTAAGSARAAFTFEDLAELEQETLKALTKQTPVQDLATALGDAREELQNAVLGSMTRRGREKVLEVIQYLGPVPREDREKAKERVALLACALCKERGEARA